ncbi:MAG: glycosyltransferase family 4 protein [Gluconacetobacter diazotrophicus]|nr:glycosyltransferase family 4 protein [Gluconacetobacter diazotrophicus]
MRILFTFENPASSPEADAEVFLSTARALAAGTNTARLHIPGPELPSGPPAPFRAWCPARPAILRHLCCGLTLPLRRAFRRAELVYTRNLWVAIVSLRCGRRVVYDHYRPWPDQIPPLAPVVRRMMSHPRFLLGICHSDYARRSFLRAGVPPDRLRVVHNGFDPSRFAHAPDRAAARAALGLPADRPVVLYAGRINHRKGLELLVRAAAAVPEASVILVGSYGNGPVEALAAGVPNVRVVPFQADEALIPWLRAADILVIPPSSAPLERFGTTVLPLKLFLYLAAERAIVAGATPDVRELLVDGRNAVLCPPDSAEALGAALRALLDDPSRRDRLAAAAAALGRDLSWQSRAARIRALVAERAEAPPEPAGVAPPLLFWLRRCGRWLGHLARNRTLVLPPERFPPAGTPP